VNWVAARQLAASNRQRAADVSHCNCAKLDRIFSLTKLDKLNLQLRIALILHDPATPANNRKTSLDPEINSKFHLAEASFS